MDSDGRLGHILDHPGIIARSAPRQKAERDSPLASAGRQVSMIGEGIAVHPTAVLGLQRLAGNNAVGRLVAASAGLRPTVQRNKIKFKTSTYSSLHKTQHQDYFADHTGTVQDDEYDDEYWAARAAAVLLDHDKDERNNLLDTDSFAETTERWPKELTGKVKALHRDEISDLVKILMSYLGSADKKLCPSTIVWGPMRDGAGTSVVADLVSGGHPEGSSAGGWNPWAVSLSRRADSQKSLYARGHLLNRHLGGPGLDYNMTPLTSRSGWSGANDANAIHSALAEAQIKQKFELMTEEGPNRVTALHYEVRAVEGSGRALTGIVENTTREFVDLVVMKVIDCTEKTLEWEVRKKWKLIAELTSEELDQIWQRENERKNAKVTLRNKNDFTDAYVREYLVREIRNRDFVNPPIKKWEKKDRAKLKELYTVKLPYAKLLLDAVTIDQSGDLKTRIGELNWDELSGRLKANAALWAYEDAVVPGKLVVWYRYEQYGVTITVSDREVPVDLPSEINTPFWHEERKNMLND